MHVLHSHKRILFKSSEWKSSLQEKVWLLIKHILVMVVTLMWIKRAIENLHPYGRELFSYKYEFKMLKTWREGPAIVKSMFHLLAGL
jgi:hypothetical protein